MYNYDFLVSTSDPPDCVIRNKGNNRRHGHEGEDWLEQKLGQNAPEAETRDSPGGRQEVICQRHSERDGAILGQEGS